MAQKKQKKKKKTRGPSKADKADRYALYQKSVQAPDVDVEFFDRIYKSTRGCAPKVLREDFCGAAAICCEWVKLGRERRAFGIDLDPEPIAWGKEHNLAKLTDKERARVTLIEGNVLSAESPAPDIVAAQNFSYFIFKTRDALRDYFKRVRQSLGDGGLFVLDLFGGYEAMEDDQEDVTDYGKFDYVWEQEKFDPITHDITCHIHFRFRDGSELARAFTYEWRFWTIPEVREVLLEAGFDRAEAYWEEEDPKTGDGSGHYVRTDEGSCDPAWNAYVVGVK